MTKFYDAVYSFERVGGYQFVKLYISMFENRAWVTAMAAGGEQTRSAHARDVSLGARIGHFHWMTMSNCQLSSKTNEWLAHNITRSFYSNNPNEWTEKSPAWTDVFWLDKYKLIWSTTWSERAVKMCQAPSVQTPHKHCENSVISEKNALRTGSVIHEHYL